MIDKGKQLLILVVVCIACALALSIYALVRAEESYDQSDRMIRMFRDIQNIGLFTDGDGGGDESGTQIIVSENGTLVLRNLSSIEGAPGADGAWSGQFYVSVVSGETVLPPASAIYASVGSTEFILPDYSVSAGVVYTIVGTPPHSGTITFRADTSLMHVFVGHLEGNTTTPHVATNVDTWTSANVTRAHIVAACVGTRWYVSGNTM